MHERALCDSDDIGAGTRVWAFAHVQDGAVVGRDCNIGEGAFIEDGARLGDRVVIKNGVCVWGLRDARGRRLRRAQRRVHQRPHSSRRSVPARLADDWLPTHVLDGACIGANATIVCGTVIGRHALIGAGAVVTRDVPDHAIVVGNPSKLVGWICVCGERLEGAGTCGRCGRTYEQRESGLAEVTRLTVM